MVTVGVYIAYINVNLHYSIVGTHPGRYLTLAGLLGRARACHQTRGGVGIIVHIPGHIGVGSAASDDGGRPPARVFNIQHASRLLARSMFPSLLR